VYYGSKQLSFFFAACELELAYLTDADVAPQPDVHHVRHELHFGLLVVPVSKGPLVQNSLKQPT